MDASEYLLALKTCLRNGEIDLCQSLYKSITEEYPDTPEANEARRIMESTRGFSEAEDMKAEKSLGAGKGRAVLYGIGHSSSLLLLVAGIGMMLFGFSIREEFRFGGPNWFESLIVMIFSGGSILAGALLTAVTIGTWVFALAMQYFGRGELGWTIAILVLVLLIFSVRFS